MFWNKKKESYEEKLARLEKERAEIGEKLQQQTKIQKVEKDIKTIKAAKNKSTPIGKNLIGVKEGFDKLSKAVSSNLQKPRDKNYNPVANFGAWTTGVELKPKITTDTIHKKRYAYVETGKNRYIRVKSPSTHPKQTITQPTKRPILFNEWELSSSSDKKKKNPLDDWGF